MSTQCFIVPDDVLFLRGNRLFGEPGSHGESLMPPWPSVAAGALRSWLLAASGIDLAEFARGQAAHPEVGTPDAPGSFAVTAFHLARERGGVVETLHRLPADIEIAIDESGRPQPSRLKPHRLPEGVLGSTPTPGVPVLAAPERRKPSTGWWLTQAGWEAYLRRESLPEDACVHSSSLWQTDHRVGVGLDRESRRAADGRLFSTQAIVLSDGLGSRSEVGRVGFLAEVAGANLPARGVLRFGGDGRSASVRVIEHLSLPVDLAGVVADARCRIVLTAPGIFRQGWLPEGCDGADGWRFEAPGVRARLIAAAVPRAETVSGFDLARWRPKSAQRAVPTGSVYWLDQVEATPEDLRKLAERGLWAESTDNAIRRAEGYNRFVVAKY